MGFLESQEINNCNEWLQTTKTTSQLTELEVGVSWTDVVEGAHESLKNHTYAHGIVDTKELRNSMTLIIIKGNQTLHTFLLVCLPLLNLHQRTLGSHLFPFCICTFCNKIIYHVTNHKSILWLIRKIILYGYDCND